MVQISVEECCWLTSIRRIGQHLRRLIISASMALDCKPFYGLIVYEQKKHHPRDIPIATEQIFFPFCSIRQRGSIPHVVSSCMDRHLNKSDEQNNFWKVKATQSSMLRMAIVILIEKPTTKQHKRIHTTKQSWLSGDLPSHAPSKKNDDIPIVTNVRNKGCVYVCKDEHLSIRAWVVGNKEHPPESNNSKQNESEDSVSILAKMQKKSGMQQKCLWIGSMHADHPRRSHPIPPSHKPDFHDSQWLFLSSFFSWLHSLFCPSLLPQHSHRKRILAMHVLMSLRIAKQSLTAISSMA